MARLLPSLIPQKQEVGAQEGGDLLGVLYLEYHSNIPHKPVLISEMYLTTHDYGGVA